MNSVDETEDTDIDSDVWRDPNRSSQLPLPGQIERPTVIDLEA